MKKWIGAALENGVVANAAVKSSSGAAERVRIYLTDCLYVSSLVTVLTLLP